MLQRTVGALPEPRHILRLKANSAIVEGFVSVIFDLLILATAEMLIHNICSSHNLRIVYDNCASLYLRPRSPSRLGMLLPDVAVGPSWLSRGLSILLLFVSAAAVLLGFAINGISDHEFLPTEFRSVASVPYPPTPVTFDYKAEYRFAPGQTEREPPQWQSRRLVALSFIDQCQICFYERCEYIAYAFAEDQIDSELVVADDDRKRLRPECITKAAFRRNIVNWNTNRMLKSARRRCTLARVDVDTIEEDVPTDGVPQLKTCKMDIVATRCYRRRGSPIHCAVAASFPGDDRMTLIVVKDASAADNPANIDQSYFAMTSVMELSLETIKQHLDNVAFLASLNLAMAYKMDLMSFMHMTHDVTLERRDKSTEVNVSEVDLRIAAPSVVVLLLSVMILGVAAGHAWLVAVYYKRRHNFNSFTTVPDVLELLLESGVHLNRSRQEAKFSPAIGIRRDAPRLGVQAPGEKHVGGATIDESEVF